MVNNNDVKAKVLVVDDEPSMREFLSILLEREGYAVEQAENADKALQLLDSNAFDLVISDIKMPGLDGISLLGKIKEQSPDTAVLMVTAFSTAEQAVEVMKRGAYDYIAKPFKVEEVKVLVSNALEQRSLRLENERLRQAIQERYSFGGLVGKSKKMKDVFTMIEKVAASTVTTLVTGESGTGKELAAKAIHYNGPRKNKPFIAVNCSAIPATLMESELFGHTKGSFTGAIADKPGLFEQANGGTIFLDEIGEVPLELQAKLLRVLQERELRRVGDTSARKIDVRIIAATNRNLLDQVKDGAFREDLYYRLNVVELRMPSLRERPEDIPILIDHFYKKLSGSSECHNIVSEQAIKVLITYPFPGNVRELENLVERCIVLGSKGMEEGCLPPKVLGSQASFHSSGKLQIPSDGMSLEAHLDGIEKIFLLQALERCGGVKKKAAEILGLTFRSFRYRLAKFGLDDE